MRTRNILLVGLSIFLLQPLRAEDSTELSSAIKPLDEGVPEVAVVRLRTFLKNRSGEEWRVGAEKLVEALLTANRPQEALSLLDDTRLRETRSTKFWRAQALAGLRRWNEALPFYEEVAADPSSPLHAEALFGTALLRREGL